MPTLVCFALPEEAAPFKKLASRRKDVSILVTGIGRKNTMNAVHDFLQHHAPTRVITCGFAGGLDPQLPIGAVIFTTLDATLAQALQAAGAGAARFVCVNRIATTAAEKQHLRQATQADAVEMESEVIHDLCRQRGIPCATVRVISDPAHEDLPLDFNQLSNPDQSLNFGKLALAIAKSPGKIPALLKLRTNTNLAARRLADVLGQFL
jgi:adenosylhomocysteine nucleosidase